MAGHFNSKRAFLPQTKQTQFINKILLKIPIKKAAKLCNVSERTIRDWRRGKFSMDLKIIQELCLKTNTSLPRNIKTKNRYWYVNNGASIGGIAVFKKYGRIGGDPEYRKKKWFEWWEKEGKFKKHPIINVCLPVKKPRKSQKLAEFIGIVLGDGGVTKYQITITLHHKDDKNYGKFVVNLIKDLFNLPVGKCHRKKFSVINYSISRKNLVNFCVKNLGLKIGNKIRHQIDIPKWIKRSNKFSVACVRGLIDTDGSIFIHKYKINNTWYKYKKISFVSLSKPLIQSVFKILKRNGIKSRICQDKDIRIDSVKDVKNYLRIFGSHNSKHLKKHIK